MKNNEDIKWEKFLAGWKRWSRVRKVFSRAKIIKKNDNYQFNIWWKSIFTEE